MNDPVKAWIDKAEGDFETAGRELRLLSQSAVVFRYPGENATAEDAKEVLAICKRLRAALLHVLQGE